MLMGIYSFFWLVMQAITMHMVSYAGRADLQILVAKEIIPDPQVLAKCFEDALLEMKEAAEAATKEWCEKFFPRNRLL